MADHRIHVTGAAGAGVAGLGRAISLRLNARYFDTDDYYWIPTDPPCTERRTPPERVRLLKAAFARAGASWVLGGSVGDWGLELTPLFTHVVFVDTPADVRLARLKAREAERFGGRTKPGGDLHHKPNDFLVWAAGYDVGERGGRTRAGHGTWLKRLQCPLLTVDGCRDPGELAEAVLSQVG